MRLPRTARGSVRGAALVRCIGIGFFVLLGSCNSPTLPLPPPAAPTQMSDADPGYVQLSGRVHANSLVFVYNDSNGLGVIATADGSGGYHARLPVDFQNYPDGNFVELWERIGIQDSPPILFTVRPPVQPAAP